MKSKEYTDLICETHRYFVTTPEKLRFREGNYGEKCESHQFDDSMILNEIMSNKFHLLYFLSKHSSGIFENRIIELCSSLGNIEKQSGIVNIASRSYNIYDRSNSFSKFFKEYITKGEDTKKDIRKYLKTSFKMLDIADDVRFVHEGNTGFIYLKKGQKEISLIDEGSGVNNIISILLTLSLKIIPNNNSQVRRSRAQMKIMIMEEPESNLHPNLQSKLADIFSDFINRTNYHLIIETHSEYLIRKIQYLVAKKHVEPEKIIVYYFSLIYRRKKPVIESFQININPDGSLDREFGSGFFDEADNIAIELFTLKNAQKN